MDSYKMVGCGIFIPNTRTLILSDLHLGFEDATIAKGIFLPRTFLGLFEKELDSIFKRVRPAEVILNGDVQHEFGRVHETHHLSWLFSYARKRGVKDVISIKGNHDTILAKMLESQGIPVKDHVIRGGILICHGDRIIRDDAKARTVIIGHLHPAATISDGIRSETFKCFLVGKYGRKGLVVMPSANPLIEGSESGGDHSPYVPNPKKLARLIITRTGGVIKFS